MNFWFSPRYENSAKECDMKRAAMVGVLAALIVLSRSKGQEPVRKHLYGTGQAFERWGKLSEKKELYLSGYIGALGSTPSFENKDEVEPLVVTYLECITKISMSQLAAVVDKFYVESPKFWNVPMNLMVGSAINNKNSPCAVP
jgi:hypothetical protein